MSRRRSISALVPVSAFVWGIACGAARAQSDAPAAPAAENPGVEEVVVTAQRRSESANDVPISITAVSGDRLEALNIQSTAELSKIVPGLTFSYSGLGVPVYTLRGIGFNDFSLGGSPAVTVYTDEIPFLYPIMTNGVAYDLERVEVLKGPQGTLYGQNSTAGAINYIARKPTDVFQAGFNIGYARFNTVDLSGFISGPISDRVRARVAFSGQDGDAWQQNYTRNDKLGDVHRAGARGILDWDLAENLSIRFNVNGWIDQSDTLAPQLIAVIPQTPAFLLPVVRDSALAPADSWAANWDRDQVLARDDNFIQASAQVFWNLDDDLQLTSISSYSQLREDSQNDRDGIDTQNSYYRLLGSIDAYTQELRLAGESGPATWVVGGNYASSRVRDQQDVVVSTSSNVQNIFGFYSPRTNNFGEQEAESASAFISSDWKLAPTLTLTTGARYTRETRDFIGCTYDTGDGATSAAFTAIRNFRRAAAGLPAVATPIPAGSCITFNTTWDPTLVRRSLDEDNVAWRTALSWQPDSDLLFYGSVSKGYKSGSFPTISATATAQYSPVVQEQVLAYELGYKATLFGRSVQFNGAAFYYDYSDKQLRGRFRDAVFGVIQALVNVPESSVQGAEVDLVWLPVRGLTFSADASYVDTQIDKYVGINLTGALQDFKGSSFNFTPKWQMNFGADYEVPISAGLNGFVGILVADRTSTSADFSTDPLLQIKGYTLVDIRAGIAAQDSSWRLTSWVKNAGDTYYWTNAFRALDTVVRIPGQPRTYGITFSRNF